MLSFLSSTFTSSPAKPKYDLPPPTIGYSQTKPHYELVVFNDCFANDKCALWKASDARKKSIQGFGCAINTMRFLNVISSGEQETLLDLLNDSGTPFKDTMNYVKQLTHNNRKFIEKQYTIETIQDAAAFFRQLRQWMPINSCVIYRENLYGTELGHTGIFAKDQFSKLYSVDPIYNRIVAHNNDKYYNRNSEYVESISLMFQLNLTPIVYQSPPSSMSQTRRRRRRNRQQNQSRSLSHTQHRSQSRSNSKGGTRQ